MDSNGDLVCFLERFEPNESRKASVASILVSVFSVYLLPILHNTCALCAQDYCY